jgi:hypothetical protein
MLQAAGRLLGPPDAHLVGGAACQQRGIHLEPMAEYIQSNEQYKDDVKVGVGGT